MFPFRIIFDQLGVRDPVGASKDALESFEADMGLALSPESRAYFGTCDGAVVEAGVLALLSLREIRDHVAMMRQSGHPLPNYLPLTDSYDSNPYCLWCTGPLTGHVVHIPHDDVARVAFRSIASFLTAVAHLLEDTPAEKSWPINDLVHDFAVPERLEHDIVIGRALIQKAHTTGNPLGHGAEYLDYVYSLRFGITLLSDAEVAEVIAVIDEARDPDVLLDTTSRLRDMAPRVPQAAEALQRFDAELMAFLERCRSILQPEEMVAIPERTVYPRTGFVRYTLTVRAPYTASLNLDGRWLYIHRKNPDFDGWLLQYVRRLLTKQTL